MEIFLFIVLLIILLVYLNNKFSDLFNQNEQIVSKADKLENDLNHIKSLIYEQNASFSNRGYNPQAFYEPAPTPPATEKPLVEDLPVEDIYSEAYQPLPIPEEKVEEPEVPSEQETSWQERFDTTEESTYLQQEELVAFTPAPATEEKPYPKQEPSFFDNLDWEKFIGENLINKIGIGILVLGIGFFVKYAIDKEWINEIGRVFIGILCGGILVGFAHKLRKEYSAFSSVLIGGGLSVFYFSIAIAFHEYQLIGQTPAFLIMVLITAFAVLLSLAYNRQELAVLAIIGGFTTPFLVSTGEGNYVVLFSYLLILNTGMLVLAYFKKWTIVNIVSYAFTLILYSGWLATKVVGKTDAPYGGALIFATLFYLEFFVMNIIHNLKERKGFIALDFTILLSNTFAYYAAGMIVLDHINGGVYKGLFTVLLAIFNFMFAFGLFRSNRVDKNVVYLLIGLVVTFISLAGPVQLEGNWITMFWALEGVLLLWLAKKSGISLMKLASLGVTALMLISLVMDWNQLYTIEGIAEKPLNIILNKAFITSLLSLASLLITRRLLKNESDDFFAEGFPPKYYRAYLLILLFIGSYITLLLELNYQLHVFVEYEAVRFIYLGVYHFSWLCGLSILIRRRNQDVPEFILPGLAIFSSLLYLFIYHGLSVTVRNLYLTEETISLMPYLGHYLITLLFIGILALAMRGIREQIGFKTVYGNISLWSLAVLVLFIASAELDHLVVLSLYAENTTIYNLLTDSRRIGYPLVWAACSFAFMFIGIKKKMRPLRIISLSIFFIILLKLFLVDVGKMPEGGKIAAFIILGLLLLIISFMYQKLKKLITEDEAPELGQIQTPLS